MPIVCGIHPVLEALAAGSRTIERVVVTKGVRNKRILEVIRRASERGVPLRFEPREALDRAVDGERHQGVLAIVADKGLLSIEELQKGARTPALFVLLDGVEDPRNMGAIIRSVDAAGGDGVILPDRHTASLSDAASRTAAGAMESVRIARIGNVVQALESLKAKGFWIVGFDGSGKERWDTVDYKRPIVLVLGGEGKGIRRLVKEHCDHVVALPVFGQVSSLNVSVAAGIALYEAVRQRGTVPTMARPIPPRALVAKKPVVIGPPPEDREEDPGARRRAAAIASLALAPEPVREAKPGSGASEPALVPVSITIPGETLPPPPEAVAELGVQEASVEEIAADSEATVGEDGGGVVDDEPDHGAQKDDGDLAGGEGDEGEGDSDEDGEADDTVDEDEEESEEDDDEGEDDAEDGEDEDEDDDEDEDEDEDGDDVDEDDEDQGDEASELATPFMPEDNSGGGEVTWGSEKELRAHRPRREGERRFGKNGPRRSGKPGDRTKKRKPQSGVAAPQGDKPKGDKPQGQRPAAGRDQTAQPQRRRGRDQNRGPRPSQTGQEGDPQKGPENARENDGARPDDGVSSDSTVAQNGLPEQGTEPRDPNRPGGNKRRSRRRRGSRGRSDGERRPGDPNAPQGPQREGQEPRGERGPRSEAQGEGDAGSGEPRPAGDGAAREGGGGSEQGRRGSRGRSGGERRPGDLNAPQGPPREGEGPRGERGPRSEAQGEGDAGSGEPRPAGDGAAREGGGGSEQSRRDRDRRRRRRRGRRGGSGPGGGQNGGPSQGGSDGGSSGDGGGSGGDRGDSGGGSDSGGGGGGENGGNSGSSGGASGSSA